MSDERVDLSALDPIPDPRFERMVTNITTRAHTELARRAAAGRQSVVELVASWARPALAAAATIAVVSMTLLALFSPSNAEVPTGAYMPASEVPPAASEWYEEDREPTASDLLVAVSQGDKQ